MGYETYLKCVLGLYLTHDVCYSKIAQYSPSESTKVYDKAVNRKHKTRFNPKATLLKVKRETPPLPQDLGVKAKKDLLSEYLEVRL